MWQTDSQTGLPQNTNTVFDPKAEMSLASMIEASVSMKMELQTEEDDGLVLQKEKEMEKEKKKEQEKEMNLLANDRLCKEGRSRYRKALRNTLPILTRRDLRRFREPFHEALCEELKEDGYLQTAAYLQSLVKLDYEIRKFAGPESVEWRRPRLSDQMDFLIKLRIGLIEAEIAQRKDQAELQCTAYLQLATFFMRQQSNWWWLAEQLLLQAVEAGKRHRADGGWHEALARYIYGAFLFKQLHELEDACLQLRVCRDLTAGRDWTFPNYLCVGSGTLFTLTTVLLHQATMSLVRQARLTQPKEALRLAKTAAARVRNVGLPEEEAEAVLELAASYEEAGDPHKALHALSQYWPLDHNPRRRCDAHLVSAMCYHKIGKSQDLYAELQKYLHHAEEYDLQDIVPYGHLYLGEYHLTENHNVEASAHLVKAFTMYYRAGQMEQMELARALAGVAAAQEHYSTLSEMIINSKKDPLILIVFSRWKENRTPFWMKYLVCGSKYEIHSTGEASLLPISKVSLAKELSDADVQSIILKDNMNSRSIKSVVEEMKSTQQNIQL